MGGRTGRGGGRTREPTGRVGRQTSDQDGQGGDRGNRANGGIDAVPDFSMVIAQQLQDLVHTIIAQDFDGKGGAIAYTRWTKKMESVHDMSGCGDNQKVKYTTSSFIASHAGYTNRFYELARLVPHLVTLENKRIERYIYGLASQIRGMVAATEPTTIQSVILKARVLTDEAIRNGSLRKNTEKRGNGGELSRDGNVKDDNKRSKTRRAFAKTTNPVMKEYIGHFAKDCRAGPRIVNPLNAKNVTAASGACFECGGQGHGNNGNPARGRTFVMGAEEAHQDPNIMTGTFTLNNHYATTLFDSGADYSFVFTTFIPLLDIELSNLGFSYEIKIARGQLVEINQVIGGCKLEIEGHTFYIDLIPFRHGSSDVIVGMDWLSRNKAEIVCHEKVVRIPLPHIEMLRVLGGGQKRSNAFWFDECTSGIHGLDEPKLMHNYHLDRGPSRCAFKVDIQKAYDTVDWAFLNLVLMGFGFHERMIAWIMECVSSTSYSICINGNLHGYCDKLELINLCFADDLFIFAYGDVQSVVVIKECLDEFKHASIPKSTAFFCNVLNHVKLSILNVLPFEEGRLPVKYLGVPLVSSRLKARDCKELVEKVQNRVLDWKNKALSIAGRLQLIRSVISSMHVFWASVFVIPNRVLMDIEQCMRNFLWCPSSSSKGKAKVAWELVCLPKDEGGLGIRRLEHFNSALLVSHIWNLLSLKESLWVKWVHAYKLNGRNFWDVPIRGNMSWSWRKILQLRPSIREFIWRKIGNGSSTSIWFDKWCHEGPLASRVSPRDIHRAGLTLYSQVGDVIRDGDWVWPRVLLDKYQFLNECTVPLSNNCDTLEWRLYDGTVKRFSVAQVWECIRPRADKVPWVDLIWFAMGIPRHAFNLWLIINHKLKTQDRVSIWDYSNVLGSTCPLCEATPDSHEHLFFICPFANSVWSRMKVKAGLGRVSHNIYDIVDHFGGIARRKTTHVVIAKLVVAASAYFIWQERNWRLFKKSKRSIDQVVSCISSSVRMKLLSCAFKRTTEGVLYARLWDLPNSIFR
ncbi:putative RNA-directed DNA polymerase [Tanacetum coccineum]